MSTYHATFKNTLETPANLAKAAKSWMSKPGRRFGHLTARVCDDGRLALVLLLLDTGTKGGVVFTAPFEEGVSEYPAISAEIFAAHWAERAVGDFFGLLPIGHPRWKSVILHDGIWPNDLFPLSPKPGHPRGSYEFMLVTGEGIHEIPVGPIHAGIIEPGHFRFSCSGEVITNLSIRLGYLHRGVEKRLTELPWQQTRFLAESASTDTALGNALAHTVAIEQLLIFTAPARAQYLRTIALELERLSNHVGDLGALAGDVGYSAGAALFPPMRGAVLSLAQLLAGSRRMRYYVKPGGVSRDLTAPRCTQMLSDLDVIEKRLQELVPLLVKNASVIERMEGTGTVPHSVARDFGLVGPAARASGRSYDARRVYPHGVYPEFAPELVTQKKGDVFCRMQQRADEIWSSIDIIRQLLQSLPEGSVYEDCQQLMLTPNSFGLGIVEAWRGELMHWIFTDESGGISRYAIKDPSFNNWTGLSMAVRGNLVADFPVCNKSFNLSYSGNDL